MIRILFVDDEVRILEGLRRLMWLQRREWEMAFAPGGKSALTMLEACPFDVIVADMRMPEMDGAELLEIVREKYPTTLRFILSGFSEVESSFRAVPVAHQFLLMPCNPEALRAAIERATSLLKVLNSKMLVGFVGSLRDLPSLPGACVELRRLLAAPDVSIERVVRVMEQDPAMSAKTLQLVNSAFFRVTKEISNITTAVTYLGMAILQNLVLSVEIFRTFQPKHPIPGFTIDQFHKHSQLTAKIASEIGQQLGLSDAVSVAGLLHDIGKLVIAEQSPDHFARAIQGAREEKTPLFVAEENLTGISHAEVGAYLLSLWGLPVPLVEAVAHHHRPERVPHDSIDMIIVVYLANLLAKEQHDGDSHDVLKEMVHPSILAVPGVVEKLPEWQKMAETIVHEQNNCMTR